MKKISAIIALFVSQLCNAQNYQCVQTGVKHYFTNTNGYLRAIRIDSTSTIGDSTIYYPFHTPRGSYDVKGTVPPSLDVNGGSWLGKQVVQLNDGTFIFDSYWNDSVIIKTQANTGDSWVLYKDTSTLYYTGTVTGTDTMTVLSVLDSIKTITINAHDPSGIVTTDSLNGFTVLLSKNHGFVQVCDLYTFPYHKPDSVYRLGLDFFLDRSTYNYTNVNSAAFATGPNPNISLFKLVDFIIPNDQQLRNWNIGDVIESFHQEGFYMSGPVTTTHMLDTVTGKTVSGSVDNYTISGSSYSCPMSYPCSLISNAGSYAFDNLSFPIVDTSFIPEQHYHVNYLFYFPYDTNYCLLSPAYVSVLPDFASGFDFTQETTKYKYGIGETYFNHFDDELTAETDQLLYYNVNGVRCGTPLDTNLAVVNNALPGILIQVYPNPAIEQINIQSNYKINSLSIDNLIGQTLYTNKSEAEKVSIDVSNFAAGVYFIKINNSEIRKFVKQ